MIYTIGFDTIEGTENITKDTDITSINPTNIIVINANGPYREQWEKVEPFSPSFKFYGILPTCSQKEQIYQFIQNGGTVISSLPDPEQMIETIMFHEEVQVDDKDIHLQDEEDDSTTKVEYSPFDWLLEELNDLAKTAYNYKKREYNTERSAYIESTVETIAFFIGDSGGKVIFTKKINNKPINLKEIHEINEACRKKDEGYATTK